IALVETDKPAVAEDGKLAGAHAPADGWKRAAEPLRRLRQCEQPAHAARLPRLSSRLSSRPPRVQNAGRNTTSADGNGAGPRPSPNRTRPGRKRTSPRSAQSCHQREPVRAGTSTTASTPS